MASGTAVGERVSQSPGAAEGLFEGGPGVRTVVRRVLGSRGLRNRKV
jgi:hypothetical protein